VVHIVSAGVGKGKTSRMISLHGETGGEGIVSPKAFAGGEHIGYDALRLSDGERMPFIRKAGFVPAGWDQAFRFDRYSFSGPALEFASQTIGTAVSTQANVFIDEIGPAELAGLGFRRPLAEALQSGRDLYIAARESCVAGIIGQYGITAYRIIEL
jgi:nucleoside-triphosphatase THEP1